MSVLCTVGLQETVTRLVKKPSIDVIEGCEVDIVRKIHATTARIHAVALVEEHAEAISRNFEAVSPATTPDSTLPPGHGRRPLHLRPTLVLITLVESVSPPTKFNAPSIRPHPATG